MGVGGQDATNFLQISSDAQENSTSFDTNLMGAAEPKKVMAEKLPKKWILRGFKLRGLRQNQISTANFIYENDQLLKINTLGDFEIETPTHMSTTHAIKKPEQKFQNRIPRELDQNFDIPGISMIH